MDILRLALLHDMKLMELYSLIIWGNIMGIELEQSKTYERIFGLD